MRQVSTEEKSVLPTKEGNTSPEVLDSKCRVALVLTKAHIEPQIMLGCFVKCVLWKSRSVSAT